MAFINRISVLAMLVAAGHAGGDDGDLLKAAQEAFRQGQAQKALALANQAIGRTPTDPRCYLVRGQIQEGLEKYQDAIADCTKALALDPKTADAFQQRGSAHFKLGKIAESITDFDSFLQLQPKRKASHWQRGISYYYAGRFDEGRQQFEGYQTYDSNDVENAVWRYLCMARTLGVAKARAQLLKIGKDERVPMKEIYELFAGRLKPADILAAAQAEQPPPEKLNRHLFYAHLYLGLYYESEGDKKRALEHLTVAAEKHRIGHYMWDVARVHRDLLKKELSK